MVIDHDSLAVISIDIHLFHLLSTGLKATIIKKRFIADSEYDRLATYGAALRLQDLQTRI
jgi:hypothetical protein